MAEYRTPGVYVEELNAFPPSIVGVQSAIPAFIGYTEQAMLNGTPVPFTPIKITSLADYEAIFAKPRPTADGLPTGGVRAEFTVAKADDGKPYDFVIANKDHYTITQEAKTKFNLYNSMRLFFANGGGACYVVSIGDYTADVATTGKDDMLKGITAIGDQVGPTMLLVPDAINLPADNKVGDPISSSAFKAVVDALLNQCATLMDRVALLDVYATEHIKPSDQTRGIDETIKTFRGYVQDKLNYGIAYFPFLLSTVVSASQVNYTYLKGTDNYVTIQGALETESEYLYGKDSDTDKLVKVLITNMSKADTDVTKNNQDLVNALPVLAQIYGMLADDINLLPPSPAMAGVITATDLNKGVWNAPANVSLASVTGPSIKVTSKQQEDLNVPVDGKAVNAIRDFVGRGTVVWGARTLDGNSPDWRYVQVRRAIIYIEQSIKAALQQYVFAPNDAQTWVTVTSMISNFLQGVWSQGGLMGAKASDAFTVQCGVGSTMTGQDILAGYMRVQVTLQMIRPAEFIVLTFKQQMQGA